MNALQALLYGIISGISQFLPVPAAANQTVLLKLFGMSHRDHLCDVIVHICILASLYMSSKGLFDQTWQRSRRKPSRHNRNNHTAIERTFIKNASNCTIIMLVVFLWLTRMDVHYLLVSAFLVINGLLLYAPSRMYQGNKDARSMSVIDSVLIGAANAFTCLPGFSGAGSCASVMLMRGVDRQRIANWVLMLSIPTLLVMVGGDVVFLISNWSIITFGNILSYLIAGVSAYAGGYFSIVLLRLITKRIGFHEFAFYSWGLALLMLILFLI